MAPAASRRGPRQPQTAVWISDMMLRQALDQYLRRSFVTNRGLSCHRGLNQSNRRPSGQRHMAGMLASDPPYRPTWWFELLNKDKWQWQSPTTSDQRREKESEVSLSRVGERIITWLEASDLDKPFLDPPAETLSQADVLKPTFEAAPVASAESISLMMVLSNFRASINNMESIEQSALDRDLGDCNRNLRAWLHSGAFDVAEIPAFLNPWSSTQSLDHRLDMEQLRIMNRFTASNLISTVALLRHNKCGQIYEDAWAAIVERIFTMTPGEAKFRLFRYMMSVASPADVANLDTKRLIDVSEGFISAHGDKLEMREATLSTWAIQTTLFSQALDRLSTTAYAQVSQSIADHLQSGAASRHQGLIWLIIQASLKRNSQEFITEATHRFARDFDECPQTGRVKLLGYEVWMLSLARLGVNGVVDWQTLWAMVKSFDEPPNSRWTRLLALIVDHGSTRELAAFLDWLDSIGQLKWVPRSLVLSQLDPKREELGEQARRVMEAMMNDEILSRRHLRMEMNIARARMTQTRTWDQEKDQQNPKELLRKGQMKHGMHDLLGRMAYWFMQAPQLSNRQALSGVQWCLRSSEAMSPTRVGSPRILGMLAKVILEDLENGKWGRTTRLQWLIEKTKKYEGTKAGLKVMKKLDGWRTVLREERRGRKGDDEAM